MEDFIQIGSLKEDSRGNKKNIIKKLQRLFPAEWADVGGLSVPSKMPGFAYSTPAKACLTGAKLRGVPGSTCHKCYAVRGNYTYPTIQRALNNRLTLLADWSWVPSMVTLINAACEMVKEPFFRWHDSGDIQGLWHLENIVMIANNTPHINHWLPTREYKMVNDLEMKVPSNLIIRLSSHMIDGQPPTGGLNTSTVSTNGKSITEESFYCNASSRQGFCGDCRSCWNGDVKDVTYPKH